MLGKLNNFTDMKERYAYINKIFRRMHDEAYFLPLWANDTLYVTSKKVDLKVAPYLAFTPLQDVAKPG
jgi:ABC-type transport system substrate-binding protein